MSPLSCLCGIIFLLVAFGDHLSADDRDRIAGLIAKGGLVTLPPGDYELDGTSPIPLPSNTSVVAYGARMILPKTLGDSSQRVLFSGENLTHFAWHGGEFIGHVFDPAKRENDWEPHVQTKCIEITTTREDGTHDLLFRDLKSDGIAGAVIGVHGLYDRSNESEVTFRAKRIVIENCTLLRSGKFMWDYGYLWQILTFPEFYEPWEVDRARRYFRLDLVRPTQFAANEDRIQLDNTLKPIAISSTSEPKDLVSFWGTHLPSNLVRGRQYHIVESTPKFLKIAEQLHGPPLIFESAGRGEVVANLQATYLALYAPTGSRPGKGAFDIVGAQDIRVSGCQLSALGDTMHLQRSRNIVFAHNHILGSRMGAFFLAEFCENAAVTGNLIDGTNGSRVMSVEKSCRDVTITGNTFRGGGRGAWINQPVNFVMTGNIFINNTTKNDSDLRLGRIAFQTAQPVKFPELYFTLYKQDGEYGPVLVRDNLFQLGDHCPKEAITFGPRGHDIVFERNTFSKGEVRILVDPSCSATLIKDNLNATTVIQPVDFHHGRR